MLFWGTPDLLPQSYLPLGQNDKWFFDHGNCVGSPVFSQCTKSKLVSYVTADSTMPNGYTYYKVNGIAIGFYEWFRSDTNWVYAYNYEDSLDLPIFNLHSTEGETYQYGKEEYQITTLKNIDTLNIFNDKVKVLDFVLETGLDITNEFQLSDKYGFIKYDNIGYGGWSYSNLIGCIINGKSYGDVTSIDPMENQTPSSYKLYQNYPNPFNPVTTIMFNLPYTQKVELKIYNALGNEIATLINGIQRAGIHKIKFDGKNLSSGIYIYQIRADHFKGSKKFVLLK